MFKSRISILSLGILAVTAFRLENSDINSEAYRRVIVVSDMHGDSQALLYSLYLGYKEVVGHSAISRKDFGQMFHAAIVSSSIPGIPLYTGNDVALVQMGDLVDRGKFSLSCVQIMKVAQAVTGFKTITLIGNHELVAILRDGLYDNYIHPQDDLVRDPADFMRPDGVMWRLVTDEMLPLVRWGPSRPHHMSSVVSQIPTVATLFVHAGITEEFLYRFNIVSQPPGYQTPYHPFEPQLMLRTPLSDGSTIISTSLFNRMVQDDLLYRPSIELAAKYTYEWSPFMSRDYGSPDIDCASIDRILSLFDVSRIVIGHIASSKHQIRTNCGGKIFLSDTCASRYMYGRDKDDSACYPGAMVLNAETRTTLATVSAHSLDVETMKSSSEIIWTQPPIPAARVPPKIPPMTIRGPFFATPPQPTITDLGPISTMSSGAAFRSLVGIGDRKHFGFIPAMSSKVPIPHEAYGEVFKRSWAQQQVVASKPCEKTPESTASVSAGKPPTHEIFLYQDGFCKISKKFVNNQDGFIVQFKSKEALALSQFVRDEVLRVKHDINFPRIYDLPNNPQISTENPFLFRQFLITRSFAILLRDYPHPIDSYIEMQMKSIMSRLHTAKLCLGIPISGSITKMSVLIFFGIEMDTLSVNLINMSRLRRCLSGTETRIEEEKFVMLLSAH